LVRDEMGWGWVGARVEEKSTQFLYQTGWGWHTICHAAAN
jgi:hypothetical protein